MTTGIQGQLLNDYAMYRDLGITAVPLARKKPVVKWAEGRLPPESELIAKFQRRSVTGIGVLAGARSGGLAVADFDNMPAYHSWAAQNPALARTLPTVRTSRGRHVWCRSDLAKDRKLKGIGEYRGRGMSVAPHSIHKTGEIYEWIRPLGKGPLPEVPSEVFTGKKRPVVSEDVSSAHSDDGNVTETYGSHSLSLSVPLCNMSVHDVISCTLPTQPGERNAKLLELARGLKFNAGLATAPEQDLKAIVRQWFNRAKPYIKTLDIDVTMGDFSHAFERAKHPLGVDLVDVAASRIDPQDLCDAAMRYEGMAMRRLVQLCHVLSGFSGGTFFLSCHDAAPRLQLNPMQTWRLFRMMEQDEIIACQHRGNARRAARYRWIGGRESCDE